MTAMVHQLESDARLFFQGAVLSYKALFEWFHPVYYLASKVAAPLGQILFFTFLGTYATGQGTASFYIVGNAVQLAAISGVFGVTMSIAGDRQSGTLPYLFGTPANRLAMFVGRAAIHVIDGMVGVLLGLMWGVALLGLDLSRADPWGLLLAVVAVSFSTSGLGLLLGSLCLITVNVMFVNNLIYFLLLIFSGSNLALNQLPMWMQVVSKGIPLTRGIEAARALIGGASLAQVGPLLIQEAAIGLVYLVAGYLLFRWFEFNAKRAGTLDIV